VHEFALRALCTSRKLIYLLTAEIIQHNRFNTDIAVPQLTGFTFSNARLKLETHRNADLTGLVQLSCLECSLDLGHLLFSQ
jgi:hypothetical protein